MDVEFKVPVFEPKLKAAATKAKPIEADKPADADETATIVGDETQPNDSVAESADDETGDKADTKPEPKPEPKCPYAVPNWSAPPGPETAYSFEVLKGGQIIDEMKDLQTRGHWTLGKMPSNDIEMAHPTISRFHAVLQYLPEPAGGEERTAKSGWYVYDLGSTHGTFVNKTKINPKKYILLRAGYMLKFGASTRYYILKGPPDAEEAGSELTITEMKQLHLQKQLELKAQAEKELEEERRKEKEKEAQGVSWGMTDDADEETDLAHNPFASTTNEELFLQDPKKTLRGYFEREGHDLDYKVDETSTGTFTCRIELPITDPMGRPITAEFTHKGKKKECVVQCALEACRLLDRNGVLRQANHESRKRKVVSSDEEDDDEFYDRTYQAQEKRTRKTAVENNAALSYDQLLEEEKKLAGQQTEIEQRIDDYQAAVKEAKLSNALDVDDLDDFMQGLSKGKATVDKTSIRKHRYDLQQIKAHLAKVKRLINIARPVDLPPLKRIDAAEPNAKKKFELPLFGKKRTFGLGNPKAAAASASLSSTASARPTSTANASAEAEFVEEFDDDENDEEKKADGRCDSSTGSKGDNRNNNDTAECAKAQNNEALTSANSTTDQGQPPAVDDEIALVNSTVDVPETKEPASMSTASIGSDSVESTVRDEHGEANKRKMPERKQAERVQAVDEAAAAKPANQTRHRPRNANRTRGQKRAHIDVDEAEEEHSPNKFADWLPPQNQTGDGITDLNSKFGY